MAFQKNSTARVTGPYRTEGTGPSEWSRDEHPGKGGQGLRGRGSSGSGRGGGGGGKNALPCG